jgi:hypothetical protein
MQVYEHHAYNGLNLFPAQSLLRKPAVCLCRKPISDPPPHKSRADPGPCESSQSAQIRKERASARPFFGRVDRKSHRLPLTRPYVANLVQCRHLLFPSSPPTPAMTTLCRYSATNRGLTHAAATQLFARLTFNAGEDAANQPARLAHLDDGNDRSILIQGHEGPAQIVRLGSTVNRALRGYRAYELRIPFDWRMWS